MVKKGRHIRAGLFLGWTIITLMLMVGFAWAEMLDDLETAFRAHKDGEYERAIIYYSKVLRDRKLGPKERSVVFLLRGEALMDKGDLDRAQADFTRAIKIKPNYAQAFFLKGLSFEKKGLLAEAYQNVRKAVSFEPDEKMYLDKLKILEAKLIAGGGNIPEK